MKKLFISVLMCASLAHAGLVDAVALTVNNDAITLYDIEAKAAQTKGDKNAAVSMLIDELLYEQELQKHNISVSLFDINEYLERVAASNGLELYAFKAIIKQKYEDYAVFEEETKKRILQEKLVQKLVRGNIKIATQEDLEIYYDNNKAQFASASKFEVTQFASKNRTSLNQIMENPKAKLEDVDKQNLVLEQNVINGQIKYLLNSTNTKAFTPIFTSNQHYVTLLINKKEGEIIESFESVKEKIFNIVMGQREQKFLKEYFEKLKITADIKVIR
ncbi:MAG: peptidylprolyl isomerase [Deltaproteobacteria bacterium HGW-Deltaproteobacteria-24]|jgi:parvulin-like peptidyl-prolyl isomerase|nr:MAG: peptidylprolyl isomerase [Deltaproteobacteria bacterium HGW-Deltaproteobacteria-24]